MGFADDFRELTVREKLLFQIVGALLAVYGGVLTEIIYIPRVVNLLITVLWIVGITNSFNLLDISDGLAAGAGIIVCFGLAVVVLLNGNSPGVFVLLLSLAGALSAFLLFNLPPAKVYMGNAGSHFIGFIIACVSILLNYASSDNGISLFTPVFLLGFPLFDTLFVMFMRIKQNKIPFYKSRDHLALRFQSLGYSSRKILGRMLSLCFFFVVGGIVISQSSNFWGVIILFVLTAITFFSARHAYRVIIHD